jgi:hypothetical protein
LWLKFFKVLQFKVLYLALAAMPWKFQCLEGDGTWVDFDREANWYINGELSVRNFNTCNSCVNPNHPIVQYVMWSKWNADRSDYDETTDCTLNLKLMMRYQMEHGLGTPCMVRGLWDEGGPLSGKRKLHEEPWKPFVWEEYLDDVREQQMRLSQARTASSAHSPGHHAKAPPPVFGSQ